MSVTCRCNRCLVKCWVNSHVFAKERAIMKCTRQVKPTSVLHTLRGICLPTHLPRRKIRTQMSMGWGVTWMKSQATRRSMSPYSDRLSVLMVLGTSTFPWYGWLTILARLSKVNTSTPFEIGTRSLLTSPSIYHINLRNVTTVTLLTSGCTSNCSRLGLGFPWVCSTIAYFNT